jgi:nitrite reductase/ring-hydroxylating ferredoxin subunit
MSEFWRTYSSAPAVGTAICRLDAIPEPGTLGVDLAGFPILLARSGALLRAYVNACPHQFLPLNYRGERVISADGTVLRCTSHGAGFRLADGEGVEGLGLNCALDPLPVIVDDDGNVVIGSGA